MTEFATKEDRQRLGEGNTEAVVKILIHVVQWASVLSGYENKKLTHGLHKSISKMACIVQSEPACTNEADDNDPGYLFAIGFTLPNTNVKSSEGSTAAIRKRHLEVKFGELSGETARVKVRGDHRSGKYGHCAETNALLR